MRHRNFCAPKRVSTPKVAQICPICNFLIFQVEIPRNHVHSPNLKPNGWKLLHLWPTALSGTQNCPIPIGPIGAKIRNLGPYHLLDIITKEKLAKFQIKWTTASKVMRHRIFAPQKGSAPQKGYKLAPNWNFLFSRWRYLEIMCTVQIWGETVENCSSYDRPHFLGPKIAPFPYAPFRTEIGNLHTVTF